MRPLDHSAWTWEKNAQTNALWTILTDPTKKSQAWDLDEFFQTGRNELAAILNYINSVGPAWRPKGKFLDFGCGVGRVSRALMLRFDDGYGIDISDTMIELANRYSRNDSKQPHFIVNKRDDLSIVPSCFIDFVYSHMVLQHVPKTLQPVYIEELMRVLKLGGIAAFQIPTGDTETAWWRFVKKVVQAVLPASVTRATKVWLRKGTPPAGISVEMNVLNESVIQAIVRKSGCEVMAAPFTNSTDANHRGRIVFMSRDEALRSIAVRERDSRLLSQFFFVQKIKGVTWI